MPTFLLRNLPEIFSCVIYNLAQVARFAASLHLTSEFNDEVAAELVHGVFFV